MWFLSLKGSQRKRTEKYMFFFSLLSMPVSRERAEEKENIVCDKVLLHLDHGFSLSKLCLLKYLLEIGAYGTV